VSEFNIFFSFLLFQTIKLNNKLVIIVLLILNKNLRVKNMNIGAKIQIKIFENFKFKMSSINDIRLLLS
jgi:hypothetical protein